MSYKKLLGESNYKTTKGESKGYLTGIIYMAPSNNVKGINVCKFASKGCKESCLYTAGRGAFSSVQQARITKTELFKDNLDYFMFSLVKDIQRLVRKAIKKGMVPVIRLNGTSDICYENVTSKCGKNIFELFPKVQFYDYTKDFRRIDALKGKWDNYHVTFSLSESNKSKALELIQQGINVAVVFKDDLPEKWNDTQVVNGDENDLRFLDKKGVIVGLTAKGAAKKDTSGFVQVVA